jgi:uncharacterized membrane protein
MDYRLFSVFIFILSLPFIFLLAKTLFNSSLAGWIAISLYAVSPFIHFEAQEARYYILWVFFFILSNYLFLQALKQDRAVWIGYSVASVLALYTSATSVTFIFSHLVYVFIFRKEQRVQFVVSLLFIVLAYLPWMYFLYTVRQTIDSGLAWQKNFHSSFFTLDLLFFQMLGFVRSFAFLFSSNFYLQWFNGASSSVIYQALIIDFVLLSFITYSSINYYQFHSQFDLILRFIT